MQQLDPVRAEIVTGMLLELTIPQIECLLHNPETIKGHVNDCVCALESFEMQQAQAAQARELPVPIPPERFHKEAVAARYGMLVYRTPCRAFTQEHAIIEQERILREQQLQRKVQELEAKLDDSMTAGIRKKHMERELSFAQRQAEQACCHRNRYPGSMFFYAGHHTPSLSYAAGAQGTGSPAAAAG